MIKLNKEKKYLFPSVNDVSQRSEFIESIRNSSFERSFHDSNFKKAKRSKRKKEEHREGPCHFQGFRKFLSWSKKGRKNNRDDWSRGASNSRNEVSRFASGKARSKDLPRDLESRGGCTRARILWGCRCSTSARLYDRFIDRERERRERIHIEKKASEREKRVLASLARVRSRCESQENVRNGYWSRDEIPSGNIVPFLPFYLNDPSHGGGREGVRPPKSQLAAVWRDTKARYSWLLFLFSRIQFKQIVPSRLLIPTENSSELHPGSRHLKSLSRFPVPPSLRNHEPQPKYLLLYTRILCTRAYLHNLYAA